MIILRYISIFWLKNPCAISENYWCCYINIWAFITSYLTLITIHVLASNTGHTKIHQICSGYDVSSTVDLLDKDNQPLKIRVVNHVLIITSLCIHLVLGLRMKRYKRKINHFSRENKPNRNR